MTIAAATRLRTPASPAAGSAPGRTWRITTAVRAFALAVVAGQVVGGGIIGPVGLVLLGLAIIGTVACVTELHAVVLRTPWAPLAEAVVVSVLVGTQTVAVTPLLMYVSIPAVVAGIRSGRLAAANSWLAGTAVLIAAQAAGPAHDQLTGRLGTALPWLVAGLGAGLLAGSQSRSLRTLEAAQAPYAAAHRLVGQLHGLVHTQPEALDVNTHSHGLQAALRAAAGADRSTVLVRTDTGALESLTSFGPSGPDDSEAARQCVALARPVQWSALTALPLRVGDQVFGAIVLAGGTALSAADLAVAQQLADEHAIRLETALLVDDVRTVATTEERNRLARDIHDGVAQRIVSLGYLIDDVAALSTDPGAREGAEELRAEVTRLVSELRFSVFDLRHEIVESGSVSGALSEYVRELSSHSNLRVHLTLDERGTRLGHRTETELLRIAQEAIGNVHKHARAINVWVSLTVSGTDFRLVIADDGIGGASPRAGHYGLHTMRERGQRIDAELEVGTRPDGGTVVTLQSRRSTTSLKGTDRHEHHRLARR